MFKHVCVRVCFIAVLGHRDYCAITAHLDGHLCVNPEPTRDQVEQPAGRRQQRMNPVSDCTTLTY